MTIENLPKSYLLLESFDSVAVTSSWKRVQKQLWENIALITGLFIKGLWLHFHTDLKSPFRQLQPGVLHCSTSLTKVVTSVFFRELTVEWAACQPCPTDFTDWAKDWHLLPSAEEAIQSPT